MSGMLRFVRIVVVLAAGVAGWFGYEQYAAAGDPETPIEVNDTLGGPPAPSAPWANLGIAVADTVWEGPVSISVQPPDDVVRQVIAYDPLTGRSRMSLFDPQGEVSDLVEVDPNEVFVKTPGGTWAAPDVDAVVSASSLRSATVTAGPPTLVDLVPEAVWPYTVILSDVPSGDAASPTRTLTIRMKGAAFAAAEPALAAQVRSNAYYRNQPGRIEIDVELDAAGHVVAVRNLAPDDNVRWAFAPLPVPPVFEAPFVD